MTPPSSPRGPSVSPPRADSRWLWIMGSLAAKQLTSRQNGVLLKAEIRMSERYSRWPYRVGDSRCFIEAFKRQPCPRSRSAIWKPRPSWCAAWCRRTPQYAWPLLSKHTGAGTIRRSVPSRRLPGLVAQFGAQCCRRHLRNAGQPRSVAAPRFFNAPVSIVTRTRTA